MEQLNKYLVVPYLCDKKHAHEWTVCEERECQEVACGAKCTNCYTIYCSECELQVQEKCARCSWRGCRQCLVYVQEDVYLCDDCN